MTQYKAGKFVYTTDDNTVLVTKNTHTGIETVELYKYADEDTADEMAYRMAVKTAKFNGTKLEYNCI